MLTIKFQTNYVDDAGIIVNPKPAAGRGADIMPIRLRYRYGEVRALATLLVREVEANTQTPLQRGLLLYCVLCHENRRKPFLFNAQFPRTSLIFMPRSAPKAHEVCYENGSTLTKNKRFTARKDADPIFIRGGACPCRRIVRRDSSPTMRVFRGPIRG